MSSRVDLARPLSFLLERESHEGSEMARMLDEGRPYLVLAFSEYLNSIHGAADIVARARVARIPVRLIST